MPEYAEVVDGALRWAKEKSGGDAGKVIGLAVDRLAVEFGMRILKIVPGRVSTEVDARLSFDTAATIEKGVAWLTTGVVEAGENVPSDSEVCA